MSFKTETTLKFSQTDMAGIGYFNEALNIFHDQYEEFVATQLTTKKDWFSNPEWVVPIRNVQADFLKPLMAFDTYEVEIRVAKVGETSFQLETFIQKGDWTHCQILSTHVFVDKKTMKPRPIPEDLLKKLSP